MATRADLPSGTVTLCFTDIEGSTQLLETLGEQYAAARAAHHSIVRRTLGGEGGLEVDTQGDSFLYVFPAAINALRACADVQKALASEPWPAGERVRIRIGIHTGAATLTDEEYVGLHVHQAARIMAAAHGGQIVVSDATATFTESEELDPLTLVDLGEHRLKDFGAPIGLFQLAGPELDSSFPLLRTLSAKFANVPTLPGPLVGRDDDVAEVVRLIADERRRLVTLTGPGGTGKTSLALQAGAELLDRFESGAVFCDLAPVTDPALLGPEIARALGLREKGGVPAGELIVAFAREKELLLILDNLERLLDGVEVVSTLLNGCPQLAVLATSRAALRLAGEQEQPVDPLIPEDAVELFVLRSRQVDPRLAIDGSFREEALALCAHLDNLPLAIELAAARLRLFGLPELLERLERRLPLLTRGRRDAPSRQRTLSATLDWSYELLSSKEKRALARLSVFAGGFEAAAAEAVCDASVDELAVLVEQSLLRRDGARLGLLETIREYGHERLADEGEVEELRRRHSDWYTTLGDRAWIELYGERQIEWLDLLDRELENIRAALAWLVSAGDTDRPLRLCASIWVFWETRRPAEGRRALESALADSARASDDVRARALFVKGHLLLFQGEHDHARTVLEDAATVFRAERSDMWLAVTLSRLCWVEEESGHGSAARGLAIEALSLLDGVSEPWVRSETLNFAGVTIANTGDPARGVNLLEESRDTSLRAGNEQRAADTLNNLGWVAMMAGELDRARDAHEENLAVARRGRDSFRISLALGNLGLVEALAGNLERTPPLLHENLILMRDRGERRNLPEALVVVAALATRAGEPECAARLVGASETIYESGGATWTSPEREIIARHVDPYHERDTEAFERARDEGRTMTLEETIGYALETVDRYVTRATG